MPARATPDLRIEPLTEDTWEPLAAMFRERGDPRWCWCQFWRLRSRDFAALKVPELRERLHDQAVVATPARIESDQPSPPSGLVAIERGDDGLEHAVGWVGLGPRLGFERIVRSRVIPEIDDRPVWSIVCFAVSERARRRGIGSRLLAAAVECARAWRAAGVEAYPLDLEPGEQVEAGAAYTGTLAMFRRAGFEVAAEHASDRTSRHRRVVVRLALGG